MLPDYHGYVTHVNLCTGTPNAPPFEIRLAQSGPASWQKTYAGDFDDSSDHSRSGHRTD